MRALTMLAISAMAITGNVAGAQGIDWDKVDAAFGRKPAVSGDVHRYGFPRSDLQVSVDGVAIKPAFALGGWIAFKPAHGGAMAMGDLVLLETEVNPVMAKLTEAGVDITAVHNHLLRANPATFYMHVGAHGDPVKIAAAIRDALSASKTPLSPPAPPATQPAIDLDSAQLDEIIGVKGAANGGVYQFAVPRREPIKEGGETLAPAGPLGVAHAINFQPTGNAKAAITGDFVLAAQEVNPVLRTLRQNGVEVTALHSHMLDEAAGGDRQDRRRQGLTFRSEGGRVMPDDPASRLGGEKMAIRAFALLLGVLSFCTADHAARAEPSNDCKICRDQHRACVQAHSQAACKTEFDICMKHCGRK